MVSTAIREDLLTRLDQLPVELQRRVVDFADALVLSTPKGVPARELLPLVGRLDEQSAREMIQAIEEGCERIEADE